MLEKRLMKIFERPQKDIEEKEEGEGQAGAVETLRPRSDIVADKIAEENLFHSNRKPR